MKALIITVNYKGASDTIAFLDSVRRLDGFQEAEVIVVENASGDDSYSRIGSAIEGLPNVRCIAAPGNLGYFGAAKWALGNLCTSLRPASYLNKLEA
ncbi:MAG: glycosyltransferase [Terracidiphilus sp.]